MKRESQRVGIFVFFLLVFNLFFTYPVFAQGEEYVPYSPITKIDLGVASLNLSVGESYTFHVTYEPENTVLTTLLWHITDENVISIDPMTFTVTAKEDGEARIFAESLDEVSYAVCNVTVGDSAAKDVSAMKSGSDHLGLTREEMGKITAPTLRRYLDFIGDSLLDDEDFAALSERGYDLVAFVKPGSEEDESRRARDLGLRSEALTNLECVTLIGTVDRLLAFIKDNDNLIEVFELGSGFVEDSVSPEEEAPVGKTVAPGFNLQGNADALSSFTTAHQNNLTGAGRVIAVIDTGFASSHEQFRKKDSTESRFIREACFSEKFSTHGSLCEDGKTDNGNGASYPTKAFIKDNHGTHVAGIAAGLNGVAPDAQIIGVTAASEFMWKCKNDNEFLRYRCQNDSDVCCNARFYSSNEARAFNYLIDLVKKDGIKIDAVNMSYGGGRYSEYCDNKDMARKKLFDKMIEAGILPVVCAHNDSYNNEVRAPSCLSNAVAVGALANNPKPFVASYSNQNKTMIDILAPGTGIYSAVVVNLDLETRKETCTKDCYEYKNGTSMATPMVTGSIALVKQLYPEMSSRDALNYLIEISQKTVNQRVNRDNTTIIRTFDYRKPVLDLSNILARFSIPDNGITAQGQQAKLTFGSPSVSGTYKIRITDVSDNLKINEAQFQVNDNGGSTTIEINGNGKFQEGNIYQVEIIRTTETAGKKQETKIVKYFSPFPVPKTLTAASRNNSADLNLNMGGKAQKNRVIYKVYDGQTKTLVKTVSAGSKTPARTVSGLKNGQMYYAAAQYYRNITVNKKNVRVYGPESKPVWFIPMNDSFNCTKTTESGTVRIECAEDPSADGIMVLYHDIHSDDLKPKDGLLSDKFIIEIKDQTLPDDSTQYIVTKYKGDENSNLWFGSSVVIDPPGQTSMKRPENPLINFTSRKNVVISATAPKDSAQIIAFRMDNNYEFSKFCAKTGRSCKSSVPAGENSAFLVMRVKTAGKGNRLYSPGLFITNLWAK